MTFYEIIFAMYYLMLSLFACSCNNLFQFFFQSKHPWIFIKGDYNNIETVQK